MLATTEVQPMVNLSNIDLKPKSSPVHTIKDTKPIAINQTDKNLSQGYIEPKSSTIKEVNQTQSKSINPRQFELKPSPVQVNTVNQSVIGQKSNKIDLVNKINIDTKITNDYIDPKTISHQTHPIIYQPTNFESNYQPINFESNYQPINFESNYQPINFESNKLPIDNQFQPGKSNNQGYSPNPKSISSQTLNDAQSLKNNHNNIIKSNSNRSSINSLHSVKSKFD